jgi:hypothetical protein
LKNVNGHGAEFTIAINDILVLLERFGISDAKPTQKL